MKEHEELKSRDGSRPPNSTRAKFLCSYGGSIQPRPQGNRLCYCGGETKILSVDRSTASFSTVMAKLSSLSGTARFSLKYQLPREDLDALISVTDDEDLEHLMTEHDRWRGDRKIRLFLFDNGPSQPAPTPDFLLGLIESAGNPAQNTPETEKNVSHPPDSTVERRGSGDGSKLANDAFSSGYQAAYAFPRPPPPPMALGVRPAGPAVGYFPVVMDPGYMGVPHQPAVLPGSHFAAGFRRVSSESSLVDVGQQVYGPHLTFSVDEEYQFPVAVHGVPRQVLLPEMRLGKPPLPV
uniref:PB1 domain-containing protein n=1 Tax=Nymphaea colorata TaxID=210225 RepID=A0A5K1E2Q5_9MAGN